MNQSLATQNFGEQRYSESQRPQLDSILSQINPVHILTLYFSKKNFNIILPTTSRSPMWPLLFRFSDWKCVQISARDQQPLEFSWVFSASLGEC